MDRREVDKALVDYLRAERECREFVASMNRQLSPMLQRTAQLETLYNQARRQLYAELDAQRR